MVRLSSFRCLLLTLVFSILPQPAISQTLDEVKLAVRQKQFERAAQILQRLTGSGEQQAEAQYLLATLYRSGNGVDQSHPDAFKWFLQAADNGHVKAQYAVATMYENAWGTERDIKKAIAWYQKSDSGGHRQAAARLQALQSASAANSENLTAEAAFNALRDCRADEFGRFLSNGVSFDSRNAEGRTLLAEAMILGADECFNSILDYKPQLENINPQKDHAVSLAIRLDRVDYLKHLLKQKPSLEFHDRAGNTPMTLAVKQDSAEAVKLLLQAGASVNRADSEGHTPLDIATLREEYAIAKLLTAAAGRHGREYQQIQSRENQQAELAVLREQWEASVRENPDFKGWPLLHIAAYQRESELVDLLLSEGASALAKNSLGDTALHAAIASGARTSFEHLYLSVKPSLLDAELIAVLLNKAIVHSEEGMAIFAIKQLPIRQRSSLQVDEILLDSCRNDLLELASYLIGSIGLPEARRDSQAMADVLVCAIESDKPFASELLGQSPGLIESEQFKPRPLLGLAASTGNTAIVNRLLAAAVDVNEVDEHGMTALMKAAIAGHSEIIGLLIASGAAIDLAGVSGLTALHEAVAAGHLQEAKQLLDAGAKVGRRDNFSKTPLMYACEKGNLAMVELLVKYGSSIGRRDSKGNNALDYAKNYGFEEIATYLRSVQ